MTADLVGGTPVTGPRQPLRAGSEVGGGGGEVSITSAPPQITVISLKDAAIDEVSSGRVLRGK